MEITDYLIEQQGHDWGSILSEWHWLLPADLTVWMVNRFCDVIFVREGGTVHLLDAGAGTVKKLAESREDFFGQVDLGDNADNWFLISLTNQCVDSGLVLHPGQCYSFKVPPVLGGKYELKNIVPADFVVTFSFLAQIHSQTKELPDGTPVNLVVGT